MFGHPRLCRGEKSVQQYVSLGCLAAVGVGLLAVDVPSGGRVVEVIGGGILAVMVIDRFIAWGKIVKDRKGPNGKAVEAVRDLQVSMSHQHRFESLEQTLSRLGETVEKNTAALGLQTAAFKSFEDKLDDVKTTVNGCHSLHRKVLEKYTRDN